MGLAGTLPYLATSLSTVYCSWELNHSNAGYGFMISETTATQMLHLLEPIQLGYGATILSFLGAIHWGLEFAGFGGYQGYRRYAIGVAAPLVACSTLLMPIEYALISQFFGFVSLYYVDTLACRNGWTPTWYRTYRFLLTFIVGASIVVTLIGRGELPDRVPGAVTRAKVLREGSADALAEEEEARMAEKKKAAASDDRGKE
ncbi:hypothetical protein P153DRAFT_365898 [Dothidotthia symphoricarpi CBS 119687]|uniref:Uncharacterized protein n=1 Tax=Dothidotthia symphoricarpi CBS 119687 TaxID=1392245 RepID=A0A6A6AEA8_9PLEO|nr:uncharacterized protein P153DRAFT_365898 [Dothidotthia symphoricarpi CBS 119687]KAF2130262.1 hypothetical protein P153DRAFT_365898 [Dothidotthia symphoricarpi CBS 119687]